MLRTTADYAAIAAAKAADSAAAGYTAVSNNLIINLF